MRELTEFLTAFVLPLVQGGAVHVGEPVRAIDTWCEELNAARSAGGHSQGDAEVAIESARRSVACAWLSAPGPLPLVDSDLRLCAAVHNALLLQHPDVRSDTRRLGLADAALRELAELPGVTSARDIVARHSLLSRLPQLVRRDTTVAWWSGRKSFLGQAPPSRLAAMPGVRRVRTTTTETRTLLPPRLFDAIVRRSPLSYLRAGGSLQNFSWTSALPILRSRALARRAIYDALPVDLGQHAYLGEALISLANDPPSASQIAAVRLATRYVVTMLSYSVVFGQAREPHGNAGATLAVVPAAALRVAPDFAAPPGLSPRQDEQWMTWVAAAERLWPAETARVALRLGNALRSTA